MAFTPDYSTFYYTDKINNRLSYTAANLASGGIISPLGNGPTSFGNFIAPGPPCSMPVITFTITVNPSPNIQVGAVTGNITACEGTASSNPNIEQFNVSGNSLNTDINVAAPANFEISLNSASGYTNTISLPPVLGVVSSTTIFVRSAATAAPGPLTGSISCTSTGTVAKQVSVSATINPKPTVNAVSNQTLSAGEISSAVNFSGTATLYSWVNNTPGIGLAANGSGPIGSFTAVNTTQSPVIATITVTPSSATCTGPAATFSITVNPAPVISANSNLPVAANTEYGSPLPSYQFTVTGTNLSAGITVVAPASFEVSLNDITFTNTLTIGATGDVANTAIYFRLKTGSDVNTYFGSILLSSAGAANVNVILPNISVTPAPLTITADDVVKYYGEILQNNAASAAFKITAGSLKNGNTLTSVMINYGTGAAGNAAMGAYQTISLFVTSGGNGFTAGNYAISRVNGTISVLPAALTITADNKQKIQDAVNPVLTVSYSGFVNNETEAVLAAKPIISTTATTASPVGTYPIKATGALAANYTITYLDGLLTVNPAPLSIVPPNAFTPNGDGINDVWEIPALAAYPGCVVRIHSRSGQLVFQSKGYAKAWDGNYNNASQPVGAYYYVISPVIGQKPLSGVLTIIR